VKPFVSVLIDACNHERYIEQCVLSAIEQDFPASEYEIVVVDDGSTDRTPEIVRKFEPRVRLLRKQNGGQASAFNAGVRECVGEAVALLDGDDWFAKGKLAAVASALAREPEAVAATHGYYEFHEESAQSGIYLPPLEGFFRAFTREEGARATLEYRSFHIGALTVRKKFLESVLPVSEDLIFCADHPIGRAAAAMGVYMIRQPLFYYRFHAQNRYADNAADAKRAMMYELSWRDVERKLTALRVPPEVLATLLYEPWALASRERLRAFGGSPLEAIRTESRLHHAVHPNAGGLRRAVACSPACAAFLMSAAKYYRLREWARTRVWYRLMDLTRPLRHAIGLRSAQSREHQSERA
jgi:glycosyltransferase involved in cell wall biosynthesis